MSDREGDSNIGGRQAASALLADNSTYHNHKEQMAYLGAAAYIGGAAVFVFSPRFPVPKWPSIALLAFTAVAGIVYVWWQLQQRDHAANACKDYYNILVGSLPPTEVKRKRYARDPETWIPSMIILLTMFFWAASAVLAAVRPDWFHR